VSLNKALSLIADWRALYRHSKSPHWASLIMQSFTHKSQWSLGQYLLLLFQSRPIFDEPNSLKHHLFCTSIMYFYSTCRWQFTTWQRPIPLWHFTANIYRSALARNGIKQFAWHLHWPQSTNTGLDWKINWNIEEQSVMQVVVHWRIIPKSRGICARLHYTGLT